MLTQSPAPLISKMNVFQGKFQAKTVTKPPGMKYIPVNAPETTPIPNLYTHHAR